MEKGQSDGVFRIALKQGKEYIVGAYHLIRWHLIQALKLSPYDERVLKNLILGYIAAILIVLLLKKKLKKSMGLHCKTVKVGCYYGTV